MLNLLEEYIKLIKSDDIRVDVTHLVQSREVMEAFKYPSSSSGLYHPSDEFIQYGLLIHALRVCNTSIQLYRCVEDYKDNPLAYDILISSAILHDVPYKNVDGLSNKNHAHDNAVWFSKNSNLKDDVKIQIANAIQWHMGRWQLTNNNDYSEFPNNLINWTLHQSDCICSRKNIYVGLDCIEYLKSNLYA